MIETKAYAAFGPREKLAPYAFSRREPGERDVQIEILYCGICHSDLHQVRNEWQGSTYPMVPGHEIAGRVVRVGAGVTKLAVGDLAGVGCLVDSCRACAACGDGLEQYCDGGVFTYNATDKDGQPTQGGYSTTIVVDQDFVLRLPSGLSLDSVAPLLCAGITTYSPLRHWKVERGQRVGVVGLGGLGHMAVKLAAAMGAEVTVLSSSTKKKADSARLGAAELVATSDEASMARLAGRFDLLLDTVSAPHDLAAMLGLVRRDGAMVLLGAPDRPAELPAFPLIMRRRTLAGSLIGGLRETQEMLDFCGEHGIGADVEVIAATAIDDAYERMLRGDVRYRFVIDLASLR